MGAQPKMNEYKNDSRAPDSAESEEEALLSLLRSAYPSPPPGMTDRKSVV